MIETKRFPYSLGLNKEEKILLIELICNEQSKMIINDYTNYESEKYKMLENIKVKMKI